jgi:hypothetical protein
MPVIKLRYAILRKNPRAKERVALTPSGGVK